MTYTGELYTGAGSRHYPSLVQCTRLGCGQQLVVSDTVQRPIEHDAMNNIPNLAEWPPLEFQAVRPRLIPDWTAPGLPEASGALSAGG